MLLIADMEVSEVRGYLIGVLLIRESHLGVYIGGPLFS